MNHRYRPTNAFRNWRTKTYSPTHDRPLRSAPAVNFIRNFRWSNAGPQTETTETRVYNDVKLITAVDPFYVFIEKIEGLTSEAVEYTGYDLHTGEIKKYEAIKCRLAYIQPGFRSIKPYITDIMFFTRLLFSHIKNRRVTIKTVNRTNIIGNEVIFLYAEPTPLIYPFIYECGGIPGYFQGMVCLNDILRFYIRKVIK